MKNVPIWPAVCVLLITAVSVLPLFGLPVKGDDLFLHYYRIAVINSFWEQGVFFSRWAPDLLFGFGSPLFNFYPPLSAYLLTILYWIGGANGPVALNLFFILTFLLTSSGMYLAANKLFGSFGAVLTTAVYCWSPYLLLQTYSRSSLSNALALALFPWAFWAMLMLFEKLNGRWVVATALFVTAIFLSHVVSSVLFIAPFAVIGIVIPSLELARRATRVRLFLLALIAGVGLAAFFWLPAFGEIGTTKYAVEAAQVNYADFFANAWQWPAQSVAGVSNAPLPKSVGLVQQWAGLIAFIGATYVWVQNGRFSNSHIELRTTIIVWFCCLIGLSGLFLTTEASNFVWQLVSPLQGVQFPWRLLDIPVFWLAFGLGWIGSLIQVNTRSWQYGLLFVLLALMISNAAAFLSPPRTAVLEKRPLLTDATRVQDQFGIYGLTAWGEYSSSTVDEWPRAGASSLGASVPLGEKLSFIPDGFQITQNTPWELSFQTNSNAPIALPVLIHYFPGWRLTIDDQPARLDINAREWMVLNIPEGAHSVTLRFGQTPLRRTGNSVSILAMLMILGVAAWDWGLFDRGRRSYIGGREFVLSEPKRRLDNQELVFGTQILGVSLLILVLLKLFIIDQITTPLLRHPTEDGIASTFQPKPHNFNEVTLVGSEVIGDEQLVLYWRANTLPSESYRVILTLLDGRGVPIKEIQNLHPGFNRMTTWENEQLVRDVYVFDEALEDTPIAFDVVVSLEPEFSNEKLWLIDSDSGATATWVGQLKRGPEEIELSDTAVSQNADFNGQISLVGIDLPPVVENNAVEFDLIWESIGEVDINYTVFIHLLSEEGDIVEQSDGQPTGGRYPTSAWSSKEMIVDSRQWVTNAPPGNYRLQIGLYDLQTGLRLPVTGDGALGDRVIVAPITIPESP